MILKRVFFSLLTLALISLIGSCNKKTIPNYLIGYEALYNKNPREANLKWFKDAKFGLFIHYGLYSQLERGEWVQLWEKIPVKEYAKLKESFDPKNFDSEKITDLAISSGMNYITITAKHHDGFSLFKTNENNFNSHNSPAARDLIKELYESCEKKGLGLFLYYSYAADWKHPFFYPRSEGWGAARPDYKVKQPEYLYESKDDFKKYINFAHNQITELLVQYPNIAGIWLDPIMGFYSNSEIFPIDETYKLIRSLSSHALISFKQGANGDEDYSAPEHNLNAKVGSNFEIAKKVYSLNANKPKEICTTTQSEPKHWGYNKNSKHRNSIELFQIYKNAIQNNYNLLLNVGPLADGSIHEEDVKNLIDLGLKIRNLDNLNSF